MVIVKIVAVTSPFGKFQISESPDVYVYDTPGILHPNITDMEVAMNLALCGTFTSSIFIQVLIFTPRDML